MWWTIQFNHLDSKSWSHPLVKKSGIVWSKGVKRKRKREEKKS